MMAAVTWPDYLKLLRGLAGTLERLTQVERRKTEAVSRGDLYTVDECMKQEQALSMSLRGCDQKREAMLAALGIPGVNLRGLQDYSPAEYALETKAVAEELRQQYTLFQAASEVARDTLECNLRAIEKLIAQQEVAPGGGELPRQADFRA